MNLKSLLANRTFLYVVLAFSVASLFGYVIGQNTNAVLLFILTGYIATHFSKNMTVILLVPLILTNFVFNANRLKEGMKNKGDKTDDDADADSDADADVDTGADDKPKKKNGNASKKAPTSVNGGDGDDVEPNDAGSDKKKKDMAFSYLEKALNGGGLDKMTNGMNGMVKNHEKLQNMIETMTPLIDKAGALLERVNSTDMGNIGGMVDKMTNMLGGLNGAGSQPAATA